MPFVYKRWGLKKMSVSVNLVLLGKTKSEKINLCNLLRWRLNRLLQCNTLADKNNIQFVSSHLVVLKYMLETPFQLF